MEKYKILIVDDEPETLEIIRNAILSSEKNYIIYQALKGSVAFRIATKEQPDLIITDWEMPEMSGITLIENIRKDALTVDIPIIMCTGIMTTSQNLDTALKAGASDYIRKPVDNIELIARIKSMIKLSNSKKKLIEKNRIITQKNTFISTVLESLPQPVVYYNENGQIQGSNVLFRNFISTKPQKTKYLNTSVYSCIEQAKIHKQKDKELLKQSDKIGYKINHASTPYLVSKQIYYDSDTGERGILCVFSDITHIQKIHEYELEVRKREIASYEMRLLHMSKLKEEISGNLKQALTFTDVEKDNVIIQTLKTISIDYDQVWNEFETYFISVFEDFYKNLDQMYPGLSANDRRLCAFLKLNLSTKEIARITFQNPKSVDMARYRLRKKMNLDTGTNLIEVIHSI